LEKHTLHMDISRDTSHRFNVLYNHIELYTCMPVISTFRTPRRILQAKQEIFALPEHLNRFSLVWVRCIWSC